MRSFDRLKKTLRGVAAAQTLLILGIVYFLLAMPVTLLMRVFRHDPLRQGAANGSYWRDRAARPRTMEAFIRQF